MRTRGTWTPAQARDVARKRGGGRPRGIVEKRPRLRLSTPSIRECFVLLFNAKPEELPLVLMRGMFQKNLNRALPWWALAAKLLDERPNLPSVIAAPSVNVESLHVTQVNAGALTDAELETLQALLIKIGVTRADCARHECSERGALERGAGADTGSDHMTALTRHGLFARTLQPGLTERHSHRWPVRPAFYRRRCLSQPTNSIGVAMMKLPTVSTEAQNKKRSVLL